MRNRVDTDSIKVKARNNAIDPLFQVCANKVVILVQIGQARQPAIFDAPLVAPIYVALWMIVLGLVKWIDVRKVAVSVVARVVSDNIQHDPNVPGMTSCDQVLQFLLRSEVLVDLLPVQCSISVVVCLSIVRNG